MSNRRRHPRRNAHANAFTLVELLVVLAIIALLIAILMPALRRAKDQANAVRCQTNLRSLMTAFIMFAQDNKNHLPGNDQDRDNPDWWKRDWLFGPPAGTNTGSAVLKDAPKSGTIYKYVRNTEVYRCPSVEGASEVGTGGQATTNERFDYGYFLSLSGAKLNKIKNQSFFVYQGSTPVPTPVVVQELAATVNQTNMEGGHSNEDAMALVHGYGSFYASVDGSVHYFQEPRFGTKQGLRTDYSGIPIATFWRSQCPVTGQLKNLGRSGTKFGQWNDTTWTP